MTTLETGSELEGFKIYLLAMENMTEILTHIRKGLNGDQFYAVWAALNRVQNEAFELGRRSVISAINEDTIAADVSKQVRLQEAEGGPMTDDYKVNLAARLAIDQILEKEQGE
jgi:hypothetical protein